MKREEYITGLILQGDIVADKLYTKTLDHIYVLIESSTPVQTNQLFFYCYKNVNDYEENLVSGLFTRYYNTINRKLKTGTLKVIDREELPKQSHKIKFMP